MRAGAKEGRGGLGLGRTAAAAACGGGMDGFHFPFPLLYNSFRPPLPSPARALGSCRWWLWFAFCACAAAARCFVFFFSPLPPATFLSLSSPTRRCGRPVGGWGLRIGSDLSDECLVWFYSKSKSSPSSATADKCCKSTEQNVLKSQIPNGSVRVEIREY